MNYDAKLALYITIAANVATFLVKNELNLSEAFSVNNSSLPSMLLSMFSHVDESHLITNIVFLLIYSQAVFINTTSSIWKSIPVFLFVYFGSGFGTYFGVIAVGWIHEVAWNTRILEGRTALSCTNWLCKEIGFDSMSQPFVDTFTMLWNFDELAGLQFNKLLPRIGASGAVFGVMGAMLYTSIIGSPWHSKMGSLRMSMMLCHLAYELQLAFQFAVQKPLISSIFQDTDNVDHVGHVGGFLSGVVIAIVVQRLAWSISLRNGRSWGRGRRLNG